MSYEQSITCQHRSAYVLLLDMSGSMQELIEFDGRTILKGEGVAYAANAIMQELYLCACRDNEVHNYYDVSIMSYSGRGVRSMLDGEAPYLPITKIQSRDGVWVDFVCLNPLHAPDQSHGSKIVLSAEGYTPMYEALYSVYEIMQEWCDKEENYDSMPPIVFHITDGQATDGNMQDIIDISERLRALSTGDGNLLLVNIFLGVSNFGERLVFPTEEELDEHPNAFFRAMGHSLSVMPNIYHPLIREIRGDGVRGNYRGVGFNVSIVDMISMLNIGTMSVTIG